MMNTEELIKSLSQDVPRIAPHALAHRLALGMLMGSVVTLVLVVTVLGIRPDLHAAMHGSVFWMKWAYTITLGLVTASALAQLARPLPGTLRSLWLLAIPVLGLMALGIDELARSPPAAWRALWLGRTWMICPWLVLSLAAPIFAGLLWSFQTLAPTRLRAAGAVAGLAAGAWAATIYCLHCPESSALFVLTWYSLGIAGAAALGALLGPRLLRW